MYNTLKIQPVILAAGLGTRMGLPKIFAKGNGVYFFKQIISSLPDSFMLPITVIRKDFFEETNKMFPDISTFIINKNPEFGMISSVKTAFNFTENRDIDAFCIIPVDVPNVKKETYLTLINNFATTKTKLIIPVYENKKGHPVILPADFKKTIFSDKKYTPLNILIKNSGYDITNMAVSDAAVIENLNFKTDIKIPKGLDYA